MNGYRRMRKSGRSIEELLGALLIAGVLTAASVVAAGGIINLLQHGVVKVDFSAFRGAAHHMDSVKGVLRQASSLNGAGIIQLGILFLILTPVARVLFSLAAFAVEKNLLYVIITAVVFGILALSLAM
jgi:uncharacterized membrane protein